MTLVTLSAEADSAGVFAMVLVLLGVVLALDVAVFRWAHRVSDHLDESRMPATARSSASSWPPWPSNSSWTDSTAPAYT